MKSRKNAFGEFPADAWNGRELVNPCIPDALQAAEMRYQSLATLGSDSCDLFER